MNVTVMWRFVRRHAAFLLLSVLYVVAMTAIRWGEHQAFATEYDQADREQAVWMMAHGQPPFSSIHEMHWFADHFSPMMALLVPFYWIYPSFVWIIAISFIALVITAGGLYAIGLQIHGSRSVSTAMAAAFMLAPTTVGMLFYPMPDQFMAMPFVPWALWAVLRGASSIWLLIGMLLTAMCKEDSLLSQLGLGLYLACSRRNALGRPLQKQGLLLAAGSILTALFLVRYVSPMYSQYSVDPSRGGLHWQFARYAWLGKSPTDAAATMLTHPSVLMHHFADFWTLDRVVLGATFIPTLGLFLLHPASILLFLPGLLLILFSGEGVQHSIMYHYPGSVMPGLYYGVLRGLGVLPRPRQAVVAGLVLAASCVGLLLLNPFGRRAPYDARHILALRAAVALPGAQDSVMAPVHLLSHLSERTTVYSLTPYYSRDIWAERLPRQAAVRWIILDLSDTHFPQCRNVVDLCMLDILRDPSYGVVYDRDGVLVLQRGSSHGRGVNLMEPAARRAAQGIDAPQRAFIEFQAGYFDQVVRTLVPWSARHALPPGMNAILGQCREQLGNLPAALDCYRHALAEPGLPPAMRPAVEERVHALERP